MISYCRDISSRSFISIIDAKILMKKQQPHWHKSYDHAMILMPFNIIIHEIALFFIIFPAVILPAQDHLLY